MSRPTLELADLVTDPLGAAARGRAAGPIVELPALGPAAFRHEDVRTLLADARLRSDFPAFLRLRGVESGAFYDWMAISPLNKDGAEHQRWRNLMSRTFTPRSVERLRPFLAAAAHELIDAFAERGACEFMADFADPFPSLGLCELIGVPPEDRGRFRGWANTIGLGFGPLVGERIAEIDAALVQLLGYTGELAAARRAEPRDDLVSRIAVAADAEGGWSDFEVRGFIAGLVFAGHETTKTQLGWTVALLAEHPATWDALGVGELGPAAVVEEVMRHRSAVAATGRVVAEPVSVDGARLAVGEQVQLSLWGANHDETVYPHPERLDPAQAAESGHLAFGHGPHHCIGAALARTELQEALAALTARLGCPAVGTDAVWKLPIGINGPERLPITFAARTSQAASG